ncbi:uncharacterized protein Z520_04357 [Fonsecaea multimorphosa CBS 102226]|uniref:Uncharacterized protein n=1 Tax=Fonsecaea multimorphosa CBS 102226 TaxID=1442371 RepID=A0A0D2IRU4_9EURO|nr:uncharacterized protein Z520_04357 [Fonsecaea multimorphosa CBS 102226]KIX99721.1 hypothetical protein Z520_04357 [Fonsecaea multimorphosa CBS 102226]OAL26769.1 hypothetical protein AYO22_04122 [Fonsecaea multimorphosa]
MATQQNNDSGQSTLAISPSLIVGIVILAAFACIIIFASVFRYCRRSQSSLHDLEAFEETGETEFYNPNKPLSASQTARLKEVRWINNMYAWERGRRARMEAGELRPTTMIMGRKGENKNWDDYSTVGDSSWQTGSGSDESRAPYFYNLDDPYARSSQQRLSHLAPPTDQFRNSYQSTVSGHGHGYLPRHPSALLPPPTNGRRDALSPVAQKSPLRNEYLFDGHDSDPSAVFDAGPQYMHHGPRVDSLRHIERRSPSPLVNPTITVSDESQEAAAYMHSPPAMAYDANFETVTLDAHDQVATGDEGMAMNQRNLTERSAELADHRPSVVVVNDESYPQLQLQFLTQSLSQNSVSVYDDHQEEDVGECNGLNEQSSTNRAGTENGEHNAQPQEMEMDENGKGENEKEISKRNVKGMIHQWEKANASFARSHLATP